MMPLGQVWWGANGVTGDKLAHQVRALSARLQWRFGGSRAEGQCGDSAA